MRREGCGDDEVEKEEDGVVEEVVEDEVGVMLLVSMLKGLSRPARLLLRGAAGQCGEEGGSRGRHGTCSAAASIISHGGASGEGGAGEEAPRRRGGRE